MQLITYMYSTVSLHVTTMFSIQWLLKNVISFFYLVQDNCEEQCY